MALVASEIFISVSISSGLSLLPGQALQATAGVLNGLLQFLDLSLHSSGWRSSHFWHQCGKLGRRHSETELRFHAAPVPPTLQNLGSATLLASGAHTQNKETGGRSYNTFTDNGLIWELIVLMPYVLPFFNTHRRNNISIKNNSLPVLELHSHTHVQKWCCPLHATVCLWK